MKRQLLLTLLGCLLAVTASAASIEGAWTAALDDTNRVHVNMTRGRHGSTGRTFRIDELTGLDAAAVRAEARTDVKFEIRREAGTTVLEGSFRRGKGAGQFAFVPNPGYIAALRSVGMKLADLDENDSDEEMIYFLATIDVSSAYIRAMQAEGFRGNLQNFLELRMFGVDPEYIRDMRALGFKSMTNEEAVEARMHGVTPKYVREARAYGWGNLTLEKLVETRIHGATPEFAEEMKKVGYPKLTREQLVEMRIFGVTAQFVRELKDAGYENIPVEKLVEMRMHGIDASFVKKMNKVKR